QRGLELRLVDREERLRRRGLAHGPNLAGAAVLVAGGRLELREALEAERLGEADDRGARRVGPPRELLRGVEGGLVEVVDDVLPHVLLRAREVVEALTDLRGEGQCRGRGPGHGQGIPALGASSFSGLGPAVSRRRTTDALYP